MNVKKAYYYLYYKLYKFAVSISDDAINEWKPLITILVLEVLLIAQVLVWYSIITKNILVVNNPLMTFFPPVAAIGIANYLYFLHGDKWKRYVDEFKEFDKRKRLLGSGVIISVIAFIVLGLIVGFYQLSKIDWTI